MELPEPGRYATGILFVDKDSDNAAAVQNMFEQLAHEASLQVSALFVYTFCLKGELN